MTIFRSEDGLVGIVTLALIPWIGWTIVRGLREDRLPVGRSYVGRDRRAAFHAMLVFYILAGLMMAVISLDLLFKLNIRNAL